MNIAEIYESHYLPEKSKKRRPTVADTTARCASTCCRGGVRARSRTSIPTTCRSGWTGSIVPAPPRKPTSACARSCGGGLGKRLHIPDPTLYVELPAKEPYRPDVLDAGRLTAMLRGMGHAVDAVPSAP
ncbi:MAG: hypothetical protein ACLSVD_06780 [Eggerthellaceae bacterium]